MLIILRHERRVVQLKARELFLERWEVLNDLRHQLVLLVEWELNVVLNSGRRTGGDHEQIRREVVVDWLEENLAFFMAYWPSLMKPLAASEARRFRFAVSWADEGQRC